MTGGGVRHTRNGGERVLQQTEVCLLVVVACESEEVGVSAEGLRASALGREFTSVLNAGSQPNALQSLQNK